VTTICHTPIGGQAVRVTLLSTAGVPVTGAGAGALSSSWTSVAMTDQVDNPVEYRIRRGAARACQPVRTQPKLNWVDMTAVFVRADPELLHLITGQTLIADAFGANVGWAADMDTYATGTFALELWTRLTGADRCVPRYGYLLLPWLVGGVQGDVTFDRGTVSFTIKAATQAGNQWGQGPYSVVADSSGNPTKLLSPVPAQRHRHWQVTTVAPPSVTCGAVTV
jgi:hypothetical protein